MNNYDVGDIYHFTKYFFTDNSKDDVKPRHAVVLVPQEITNMVVLSAFGTDLAGQSFFMPILRPQTCRLHKIKQLLKKAKYPFLDQDRYCCPAMHDIHSVGDKNIRYVARIKNDDVNPLLNKIKQSFHARCFPEYMNDPFIRGAILQEWAFLRDSVI